MTTKARQSADPDGRRLGQALRALRLRQDIDQTTLARRAGVALNAVKNLESGKNSTVRSLLHVLRVLGREDWLRSLAPAVSVSPMQMLERKAPRVRAARKRKKEEAAP